MRKTAVFAAFLTTLCLNSALQALTVPYTENFPTNNANWRTNVSGVFMTYVASGGPDGSSYATAPFNFAGSAEGSFPVLNRGNPTSLAGPGASGDNFFGNWLAGGVTELSAYVRHNATAPMEYFMRVATGPGSPGFIVAEPVAVQPNIWTLLTFPINPHNPNNIVEGPMSSFNGVFANVTRLQFGAFVPAALAGVDQDFNFDLDQISINVPEPSSVALALAGLSVVLIGRRTGRNSTN
jgi:hypothetical protein